MTGYDQKHRLVIALDIRRASANFHAMCWKNYSAVTSQRRPLPHPSFTVFVVALAIVITPFLACAATGDFFPQFAANLATNKVASYMPVTDTTLIDRSNTNAQLAGVTVELKDLMFRGQLGPIQLGATMDDVVAQWGKPKFAYGNCYGGHRLIYSDCNLIFRGNSLSKIMLDAATVFDRASTKSNLHSWTNLLGPPSYILSNNSRIHITYETRGTRHTALLLQFDKNGNALSSPTIFLDPNITNSLPRLP